MELYKENGTQKYMRKKDYCVECNQLKKILNFCYPGNEDSYISICMDCYESLPKETKKGLILLGVKEKFSGWVGLSVGGFVGYLSAKSEGRRIAENQKEKYDLTPKELDDYSIDRFGRHYLLEKESNRDTVRSELVRNKVTQQPEKYKRKFMKGNIKAILVGIPFLLFSIVLFLGGMVSGLSIILFIVGICLIVGGIYGLLKPPKGSGGETHERKEYI